jgi:hypothetical protein
MAQVYSVDEIRNKLETNDRWLLRGILAIYARQTADEKSSNTTKHTNGVGFNGRDAAILSSFAKQIRVWQVTEPRDRKYSRPLSPKQFAAARKMMPKYAGQLARIAEENNPVEDEVVVDGNREWVAQKNHYAEIEAQRERDAYEAEMKAEAELERQAERRAIMEVESGMELSW